MNDETTVFLVDDDATTLRSMTATVKIMFPRVEAYPSVEAFLGTYRPARPGCLVLEVAMPEMSGLELQRKLIHDKISLPVIFVTAHANVPMAVEAMQLGAVNFLEKPVREHQLWGSIRKALDLDAQCRRRRARRQQVEERLSRLTSGEHAVLDLLLDGKMNKEIATELGLSTRTIEDRRAKLMKKLDASCLAELIQSVLTR
ncbi:MAG: response regulator [Planctomycetaceae bacterium]|nr:response regulator [Planctomycetaceae bacterium]